MVAISDCSTLLSLPALLRLLSSPHGKKESQVLLPGSEAVRKSPDRFEKEVFPAPLKIFLWRLLLKSFFRPWQKLVLDL